MKTHVTLATLKDLITFRNITVGVSWGLYLKLLYIMFVGYFMTPPLWWYP